LHLIVNHFRLDVGIEIWELDIRVVYGAAEARSVLLSFLRNV